MGCTEKYAIIKSYDDMFQAIRALTVQKIFKIKILSQNFLQNETLFSFSVKCFDSKCTPRKNTTSNTIIRTVLNISFSRKLSVFC